MGEFTLNFAEKHPFFTKNGGKDGDKIRILFQLIILWFGWAICLHGILKQIFPTLKENNCIQFTDELDDKCFTGFGMCLATTVIPIYRVFVVFRLIKDYIMATRGD